MNADLGKSGVVRRGDVPTKSVGTPETAPPPRGCIEQECGRRIYYVALRLDKARLERIQPGLLEIRMQYRCPDCGVVSPVEQWRETYVYCEDCGEHDALLCPECEEPIDLIYNDLEEVEDADG